MPESADTFTHIDALPFAWATSVRTSWELWGRGRWSRKCKQEGSTRCGSEPDLCTHLRVCDQCLLMEDRGQVRDAGRLFCSHCWQHQEASSPKQVAQCSSSVQTTPCVPGAAEAVDEVGLWPWDLIAVDVIEWLVGDSHAFLADTFGRRWCHKQWPSTRVEFSVEENLELLKDFNPAPGRDLHCQVMREYGFARVPITDTEWVPEYGLKFWSAIMSRSLPGVSEDIDDEERISSFVKGHRLANADDLRQNGEGYTFILNQMHGANPNVRGLHHALWAAFGLSGGINSYITPGFKQGKAPHVDDHDVFIVQQSGEKRWTLLAADLRTPIHELLLTPGDVLYIPQGLPHYACSASADPSLHLAVSVTRSSVTIAGLLAAWLELRGEGRVTRDAAQRIESRRKLISLVSDPWSALAQLLPLHFWRPLLRALDAHDLPCPAMMDDVAAELVNAAGATSTFLRGSSSADIRSQGEELDQLLAAPSADMKKQLLASFWSYREHLFEEHYNIHLPLVIPNINAENIWVESGRFRRLPDTAAFITADGWLLVNGYRMHVLPLELGPPLRYCLGMHTGAVARSFAFQDIPGGSPQIIQQALRLLLRFRALLRMSVSVAAP